MFTMDKFCAKSKPIINHCILIPSTDLLSFGETSTWIGFELRDHRIAQPKKTSRYFDTYSDTSRLNSHTRNIILLLWGCILLLFIQIW
jgi:hypothetical protein